MKIKCRNFLTLFKKGSKAFFKQKIGCWGRGRLLSDVYLKAKYGEEWGVEVGGYKRGTISAINNNRGFARKLQNKQTLNNSPFLHCNPLNNNS